MTIKKLKLCALLVFGLGFTGIQAQESVIATGGDASGSGGSVNYSVGQVVFTTNTGTNGSVAQGVQQAYEISVVSGIEPAKDINLICAAYPNPTTDFLTLKVDNTTMLSIQSMSYQLFDNNGNLLENKKLTSNETTITMTNWIAAVYFLKVSNNQKEIKTFRIIKN